MSAIVGEIQESIVGEAPVSTEEFSWLHANFLSVTKKSPITIEKVDFPNAMGLSATMKILKVQFEDKSEESFVYKTVLPAGLNMSKQMRLAREAFFYTYLAPKIREAGVSLPLVVYAYGDLSTGEKTLVLEDLSVRSIQAGYLFGAGSPLNWGKDLPQLITDSNPNGVEYSIREVALESIKMCARFHALYWMDRGLLSHNWLRGMHWVEGNGKDEWVTAQDMALNLWSSVKEKRAAGTTEVKWNESLTAVLEASFARISWEDYQHHWATAPWTLVHGDFHPANTMWRWGSSAGDKSSPVLFDWEMVGFGNGPQDIAQYLISHCAPAERRLHETFLVKEYYAALTGANATDSADRGGEEGKNSGMKYVSPETYSWEQCWDDYVRGGSERWVWLLAVIAGHCNDAMVQYFQDQVAAFVEDHGITPESVGMPRV